MQHISLYRTILISSVIFQQTNLLQLLSHDYHRVTSGKKFFKRVHAARSSLIVSIEKSLKAISLVSNQVSDISDDSKKSVMETSSRRWNESSKSSSSTADLIHEGESMFQCDTSGGSVSSYKSKMDPSFSDPKLVKRKTSTYGSPHKT